MAVLSVALAVVTGAYLNKRDQYAALEGVTRAMGVAAEKAVAAKEAEGQANLVKIKEDHESKVPEIRAGAVAAYIAARRLRSTTASGGAVPNPGASQPMDDGEVSQCVPDATLIESAAEDAAKLDAWQDYARLNGIPVTP